MGNSLSSFITIYDIENTAKKHVLKYTIYNVKGWNYLYSRGRL